MDYCNADGTRRRDVRQRHPRVRAATCSTHGLAELADRRRRSRSARGRACETVHAAAPTGFQVDLGRVARSTAASRSCARESLARRRGPGSASTSATRTSSSPSPTTTSSTALDLTVPARSSIREPAARREHRVRRAGRPARARTASARSACACTSAASARRCQLRHRRRGRGAGGAALGGPGGSRTVARRGAGRHARACACSGRDDGEHVAAVGPGRRSSTRARSHSPEPSVGGRQWSRRSVGGEPCRRTLSTRNPCDRSPRGARCSRVRRSPRASAAASRSRGCAARRATRPSLVQPGDPALEQAVQLVLADADRRVRPDRRETHVVGNIVGQHGVDIGEAECVGVASHQVEGALVDVDGPDRGVRRLEREAEARSGPTRSRGRAGARRAAGRACSRAAPRCPASR